MRHKALKNRSEIIKLRVMWKRVTLWSCTCGKVHAAGPFYKRDLPFQVQLNGRPA